MVDDWGGAAATAEDDRWGDLEADPDEPPEAEAVVDAADNPEGNLDDQIRARGTNQDETPPALPASWLPEFWAVAYFSGLATAHILLMFAQHWSVRFRAFVNYGEADERHLSRTFLMFVPMPHQGKAEIVPINALEIPDPSAPGGTRVMLWTVFQRQRFEYVETEAGDKLRGEIREVATPVARALESYVEPTRGMTPRPWRPR